VFGGAGELWWPGSMDGKFREVVILPTMALVVACMLLASFFYLSFFVPFKF